MPLCGLIHDHMLASAIHHCRHDARAVLRVASCTPTSARCRFDQICAVVGVVSTRQAAAWTPCGMQVVQHRVQHNTSKPTLARACMVITYDTQTATITQSLIAPIHVRVKILFSLLFVVLVLF